ncbi:MAG: zinc-ribbon domain-containing protein [Anaerolineae bacterium]|nr:zinc-ribbon domain-containing protein [Anaerolineae bacterium]NIN97224.1 zinc-ribbon domain-containing protein [Anaerolineae bacterium]NIQ80176.1 zinc-ribbon domain-containing protein [Anaerolineae bacterium]
MRERRIRVSDPNQLSYCPSCSYANPADSAFCQKCGSRLICLCRSR